MKEGNRLELGDGFEFEAGGIKYRAAPSAEIVIYEKEVVRVLFALGHPEAWVTDKSTIQNFGFKVEELIDASNTLGIELTPEMTIVEAAKLLAAKEE